MRNGLGHLAFALAAAYTDPLPDEFAESSEFPIFGDESRQGVPHTGCDRFHQASRRGVPAVGSGLIKIRRIHPQAQTIIEGLQPYKRGQQFAMDPLWVLHELSRVDKHRLIHVVVAWFSGAGFRPGTSRNAVVGPGEIVVGEGLAQGRTFLASFPVSPVDPSKDVYLDVEAPLDIAFGDATPVAAREPVVRFLADIYNYIVAALLPPLRPFLKPADAHN